MEGPLWKGGMAPTLFFVCHFFTVCSLHSRSIYTYSSYNSVTSHKHLHNFYTHTAVFKLNYIIDDGFMAHVLIIALRIDLKHLKTCFTLQSCWTSSQKSPSWNPNIISNSIIHPRCNPLSTNVLGRSRQGSYDTVNSNSVFEACLIIQVPSIHLCPP